MSQETKMAYLKDLRDFARFCCGEDRLEVLEAFMFTPGVDLLKVAEVIRAYRAAMLGRGLCIGTIRRRFAALRGLSRRANEIGVIRWNLDSLGLSRSKRRSKFDVRQDPPS